MKKLWIIAAAGLLIACGEPGEKQTGESEKEQTAENKQQEKQSAGEDEVTFPYHDGAEFDASEALSVEEFNQKLDAFSGDSMRVTVTADISAACKKKGCWMKLELPEDQNAHITFKDYGFFVPKDSQGHNMLVNGMAFIEETDVETLKHYAEDAGESEADIAKITEPELNYRFIATGAKAVK